MADIFEFSFVLQPSATNHIHTDIEFFYVLDGTAVFTLEDKQYRLSKDDFLVVNVDRNHSYDTEDDFLGACLHFSYSQLCAMMKQSVVFFWCNTANGNTEGYDELRRVFQKIISEEYFNQSKDAIYIKSLFYEFLHILTTDFLLNKENERYNEEIHKFETRKHEIAEYIQTNFDKPISLDDLSKQMFLSYAYLSKYIKRHFGMGFAEYLNQVRLNFAVSQLLHSDISIVRIAMVSGFASSAALNKAFKQVYNMTPTEYRRQWISNNNSETQGEISQADIRKQLERHFDKRLAQEVKNSRQPAQKIVLQNDTPKQVLRRNWCKMVNIGTAGDLLQSDIQKHLLILKQELDFEYVRFWDLHSVEMQIGDAKTGFNFNKLDQILDFLLQNGMKPYIELRPKPKILLRSAFDIIQNEDIQVDDEGIEGIRYFIRKLFIHLLNRYSSNQVESWYFEIWCAEGEQNLIAENPENAIDSYQWYVDRFHTVALQIREMCPNVRIGGGGLTMRYGIEQIKMILRTWQQSGQKPDFISLYCYPYTLYSLDKVRNQSRTANLLRKTLQIVRDTMQEEGFGDKELHASEWNFSISNRNTLNDSCMKGAYIIRDVLESLGLADIMGYWVGSDLYGSHSDVKSIIYGGCGLLSQDGIRKPAFYAFDFLNHLGKYVSKREDNYIITDNGAGNWRIVCHNLKNLNHQYTLLSESEIRIEEQNNLFEDMKKRTVHFCLPGKSSEKYLLKCLTVNQYSGSLQDEWISMSSPEEMSRDEIKYLGRVVTPRMVVKRLVAEDGNLSFDITMEPNEIAYIYVNHQYS